MQTLREPGLYRTQPFMNDLWRDADDQGRLSVFNPATGGFLGDVGRVFRVGEALDYGMVGISTGLISTEVAPFGSVKQSGVGREGARQGIEEYLKMKYLCFGGVGQ